ncbi:hypothetical protein JCM8097_001878 [Rhodosporidiobolus ruineniae]
MTAVSRPPAYTSDSVFTPLSPISSHPSTPAHLLPSRQASPQVSPMPQQQPQRNHHRTADAGRTTSSTSSSSAAAPPPQRPPRPVRLATPSQGYPFPWVLSRQNTPAVKPTGRLPSANTLSRRALANANDGWNTPASLTGDSPAVPSSERTDSSAASSTAPGLTSAFSDESSSNSSSACSTPADDDVDAALSHSTASSLSFGDSLNPEADEQAHLAAVEDKKSPLPTPAEDVHSRRRHAGSTPGAPPPARLVRLASGVANEHASIPEDDEPSSSSNEQPHPRLDKLDLAELEDEEAEKTPPSLKPTPPPPRGTGMAKNPLAGGIKGMSGLALSKGEAGVGPKREVD